MSLACASATMVAVGRSSPGTGLVGLKDRVEALGGTITVHSPGRRRHILARRVPDP